ncbi:MAG TPA: hypothetical protein PKE21_13755 [Flavobacteriales bacterium]|nr:hypothetical protein [Flavobacteriales bacterium]HMR28542.1 hypothetical protein [Flavobacteriales bacterium]
MNQGRLERIKMHLLDAKDRESYSAGRIDLLVISVSGAGVYLVFETLKFLIAQKLHVEQDVLLCGGVCFVVATLVNFASQWTGYYTNRHEVCWAQYEHKRMGDEPMADDELQKQRKHDAQVRRYGWWTRRLNQVSTGAMLLGIVLLALFYLTALPAA